MKTKIIFYEFKKIIKSKLLIFLLIAFTTVNTVIVFNTKNFSPEIKFINSVLNDIGIEKTEKSLVKINSYADEIYKKLADDYYNKFGKQPESVDDIYRDIPDSEYDVEKYNLLLTLGQTQDSFYISDSFKIAVKKLFDELFFAICAEMLILGSCVSMFSSEYEVFEGTETVYTCKAGRKLQIYKLFAVFMVISVCFIILSLFSISIFMFSCPLNHIFKIPTEFIFGKGDLKFASALILTLCVMFILCYIFSLLTFSLNIITKNKAVSTIINIFIYLLSFVSSVYVTELPIEFKNIILSSSPLTMMVSLNTDSNMFNVNISQWFLHFDGCFSLNYFIITVFALWIILCVCLICLGLRSFYRRDI